MSDESGTLVGVLDPIDRISEVLFGVIMALTFTCTFGVGTADDIKTRTMLLGALGCNLAWGFIDGAVYVLTRIHIQSRRIGLLSSLRRASDLSAARRAMGEALHPAVASTISDQQLELTIQTLREAPLVASPRLTARDGVGALAICLICFLSTLPIAAPFLLVDKPRLALRLSNAIAIVMLFVCGYAFGYRSGLRPLRAGISMVAFGAVMIAVAIALGG